MLLYSIIMAFHDRGKDCQIFEPKLLILFHSWERELEEFGDNEYKKDSLADVLESFGMKAPYKVSLMKRMRNKSKMSNKRHKLLNFDSKTLTERLPTSVGAMAKWLQCITFKRKENKEQLQHVKPVQRVQNYSATYSSEHLERLKVRSHINSFLPH